MALPATVTNIGANDPAASSPVFVDIISMAGESAYAAGGWLVSAMQTKLRALRGDNRTIVGIVCLYAGATYYAEWNPVTGKIVVTVKATGVENATADISGTTFTFMVFSN